MSTRLPLVATGLLLLATLPGCYIPASSRTQRLEVDAGDDFTVEPGEMAPLSAMVNGRTAGLAFRWSHELGPEEVEILDDISSATEAGPMNLEGEYDFRVIASTADGAFGQDFVTVTVSVSEDDGENGQDNDNGQDDDNGQDNGNGDPPTDELIPPDRVQINAPSTVPVGTRATLTASSAPLGFEAGYAWQILAGSGEIPDPDQQETSVTGDELGTIEIQVTMTVDELGVQFTDRTSIEVVGGDTFVAGIAGPTEVVVGEEVRLNAGLQGIGVGTSVSTDWQILEGEAEIVNSSQNGATILPTAEGDVVVLLSAVASGTTTGEASDVHVLLVQPDTRMEVTAELLEHLALVGEPVGVDVTAADGNNEDLQFSWSFVRGEGFFDDAASRTPNVTVTSLGTALLEATAMRPIEGRLHSGTVTTAVTTVNDLQPGLVIEVMGFGDIPMQLDGEAAPIAVANFLHYVDEPEFNFNEQVFNRVVTGFVVQGGGWWFNGVTIEEVETRDPIPGEPDNGLSNLRATVAMALRGSDRDSATQAFYINLVDNTQLDQDFTVFGRVTGSGMDVVEAIAEVETDQTDTPLDPVIMTTIHRTDTGE